MQIPALVSDETSMTRVIRRVARPSRVTGIWALGVAFLLVAFSSAPIAAQVTVSPRTSASATSVGVAQPPKATVDAAKLVTEFEVNGLKVLVKRREGSQTAVVGLFLRGGATNINEKNAGVEALMLDLSSEASANFPRERMRSESSRMGTAIS
jgi:hypothetical protein